MLTTGAASFDKLTGWSLSDLKCPNRLKRGPQAVPKEERLSKM